jgi:hypothetical protein
MMMNSFYLEVGVEISDHPLTVHNAVFPVNISLQMGNTSYTGNYRAYMYSCQVAEVTAACCEGKKRKKVSCIF